MKTACSLAVKVVPGASKSLVAGWLGKELKLRIAAPPEKGKANAAVLKLLEAELNIGVKSLRIARGRTSAHKMIEIDGLNQNDIERIFGGPDFSGQAEH